MVRRRSRSTQMLPRLWSWRPPWLPWLWPMFPRRKKNHPKRSEEELVQVAQDNSDIIHDLQTGALTVDDPKGAELLRKLDMVKFCDVLRRKFLDGPGNNQSALEALNRSWRVFYRVFVRMVQVRMHVFFTWFQILQHNRRSTLANKQPHPTTMIVWQKGRSYLGALRGIIFQEFEVHCTCESWLATLMVSSFIRD